MSVLQSQYLHKPAPGWDIGRAKCLRLLVHKWGCWAHVECMPSVGDMSWGCDMPGRVVPCQDDMALVSDGLWAAWPVSNGLEGMSEVQTHHLACGMAMETSRGIGGHCRILMMAIWPWRPCLTCVDPPLHMPEARSGHGDASQIVTRVFKSS